MAAEIKFDTFTNTINNEQRSAKEFTHGVNPKTKEKLWDVPIATQKDVEEAVTAANAAFKTWRRKSMAERKEYLGKFVEAFNGYRDQFSTLVGAENAKPKALIDQEVLGVDAWAKAYLQYDLPEHVTHDDAECKAVTRYEPIGVVAGICPWNFPLILAVNKIIPALLVGCTLIIKPSPFTPYATLKVGEVASKVLPPGVLQVLAGDDKLGPWLVEHPDIQKISFTGSIATGKRIMAAAAPTLKRVSLELGGNDASVVCEDVDIPAVAKEVAFGAFINAGQVCVATKRIYVHKSIYSEFVEAMAAVAKTFNPGGEFLPPVQNSMQYDKVKSIFSDCLSQKYEFALGDGQIPDSSGYFLPPTIVSNPPDKSRVVVEEPFGPIVPVLTWENEEDVIERANDTTTGLGACVWSKDLERADRIARRLEAGSVWINSWEKIKPTAFFSGHKESGIGGECGPLGLLTYCNAKTYHYNK